MKSDAKLFFVRFGASSTLKLERPRQFIMPGRSIRLSDALHETGTLKWNMMGSCLASNLKPLTLCCITQRGSTFSHLFFESRECYVWQR